MRYARRLSLSLLVACAVPSAAAAQSSNGSVELHQYQPSPFSDRVLRLDGPAVLPFGQFRVGADADYAYRPLVLSDAGPGIFQGGGGPYAVVRHAVGATVTASFGLSHRLEAALALPVMVFQNGEAVSGAVKPDIAGVGNVRLGLKVRLLDWRGLGLGAAVLGTVPWGVGALTHESGLGGEARVFAAYTRGPLGVGVRAGFRLRKEQIFYDIALGNELTVAAGATFAVVPRTTLFAELAGATAVASPFANGKQSPLEVLAGARQRIGKTWFTLAAGPGLIDGYGSPLFRVVAAFTWANVPPDADGDGVPDDDDACPTVPEDRDGFQDRDGCPDPDNDKDGIPDATDKCPNEPEDRDGFEDRDGCPDPDNDKDRILDTTDKCPNEPETVNEFEDADGCPDQAPPVDKDKDKDGIPNDVDECPEEPEDKDGFEDDDGCPDPDNDKDGIPDTADKCPLEPETINGVEDQDGCPDKGQSQVRLGPHEIETLQPIYFDTDRSRVRHAFHNILGQIALLLKAHPEIGRCAIEGHTDDTGPPEWNHKLSMLRAESVIEFLSSRGGVDPKRLMAIGHGEKAPWTSNDTPWGRAKNRRVVFHIEGVSAEELHKQELRQERRRIRREREREERERQRKLKGAAGESAPADDSEESPSNEKVAPAKVNSAPRVKPEAAAKPEAKSEAKSEHSKTEPHAPAIKPDRPEPKPEKSEKSEKAAPKVETNPEKVETRPAPAGPVRPDAHAPGKTGEKIAPKTAPAVPTKEEDPAPPTAEAPPPKLSKPEKKEKPVRPPKRPADAGAPPTLRELLKLPPR